jgi:adenylylsulfate kinase-like enzyme
MKPKVLWFTGLSGSGKSTIASGVSKILRENFFSVRILDGDEIRKSLHAHLGFSPDDIPQNNREIAIICKELLQNYDFILVPIISPFRKSRISAAKWFKLFCSNCC